MIQELLTGVVLDHHRKLSIPPSLLLPDCTTTTTTTTTTTSSSSTPSSPSPSPSPSLPPSSSPCSPAPDQRENLRCPRCDSSNTKFCYYNNYNLTQPRHFCKTCRRYWTKGGALRNVPIGGGCRKTKPSLSSTSAAIKSAVTKPKPTSTLDVHDTNPLLWSSPSSPHLLALLRSTTTSPFQNPNPNNTTFNLDHPLNQLGITTTTTLSPLRNQFSFQAHQQQHENQQVLFNSNNDQLQDLYQRLRSSATHYSDHLQALMGTSTVSSNNGGGGGGGGGSLMASSLTTTPMAGTSITVATNNSSGINIPPPILEPLPVSPGDFSYWNPALAWSDLHSSNGAFP